MWEKDDVAVLIIHDIQGLWYCLFPMDELIPSLCIPQYAFIRTIFIALIYTRTKYY